MIPHYRKLVDKFRKPKETGITTHIFSKKHRDESARLRELQKKKSATRYIMHEETTPKEKILNGIKNKGWFTADIYYKEAVELEKAGIIKRDIRYSVGGNAKTVWVANKR